MKPRERLGTAIVPDTNRELHLYRLGDLWSIRMPGRGELMNDRVHGSERALAHLACAHLETSVPARVLVGGLGMGFTLAAALERLGPDARVIVSELVPEVVDWNRALLGDRAGHPLDDPRVHVHVGDVAEQLRAPESGFDAILLDVDNGPEAILRRENDWLYGDAGLLTARRALRPGGCLAFWSADPDRAFSARLARTGLAVAEHAVRGHRGRKGPRHHVWTARDA